MSCPKSKCSCPVKIILVVFSCACSDAVGEEGRNSKLLDAPVKLGKKLKGSKGSWMSLSLSALCFFILTPSLHSFPLYFFVSHLLYIASILTPSLLPHYFTPPLPFSTPLPFTPPPPHLTPPTFLHRLHLTPPTFLHPLHLTPPTSLHPMPSLCIPLHALLDNEVTAVSTIWTAQPDSKTVSDR